MQLPNHWQFSAIGTQWTIDTAKPVSTELRQEVSNLIEAFDQVYSRFRPDSLVSQVAASAGTYEFPSSALEIFDMYQRFYEATDGKVTPLVGRLLSDLGYDAEYSLRPKAEVAKVPPLSTLQWNGTTLTVDQPVLIDIGAMGKGYLVDLVAAKLRPQHEVFTIDAGGDIFTEGVDERIGLEDPDDPGKVLGAVTVRDGSLCASATNRRRWSDTLHHIVDPDARASTYGVKAVWVVAKTATEADAVATALFFVEPDVVRSIVTFEFICLYDNRSMRYSEGIGDIAV